MTPMFTLPRPRPQQLWYTQSAFKAWVTNIFRLTSRKRSYRLILGPSQYNYLAWVNHDNRTFFINNALPQVTDTMVVRFDPGTEYGRRVRWLQGLAVHEAGHVRHSAKKSADLTLGYLWNAMEDERMERLMAAEYPDMAAIFTFMGDVMSEERKGKNSGKIMEGVLQWRFEHDRPEHLRYWKPQAGKEALWEVVRPLVEAAWITPDKHEVDRIAQAIQRLLKEHDAQILERRANAAPSAEEPQESSENESGADTSPENETPPSSGQDEPTPAEAADAPAPGSEAEDGNPASDEPEATSSSETPEDEGEPDAEGETSAEDGDAQPDPKDETPAKPSEGESESEGESAPSDGDAQPDPEGEAPAENGQAGPDAEGEASAEDSDAQPDPEGEAPAENGQAGPDAEGETSAEDGDAQPDPEGEAPAENGQAEPDLEGEAEPAPSSAGLPDPEQTAPAQPTSDPELELETEGNEQLIILVSASGGNDAEAEEETETPPNGAGSGAAQDGEQAPLSDTVKVLDLRDAAQGVGRNPEALPTAPLDDPQTADAIAKNVEGYARMLSPLLHPKLLPATKSNHRSKGRYRYDREVKGYDNVFERRVEGGKKSPIFVDLLIDCSGSMGDEEMTAAREAGTMLLKAAALGGSRARVIAFNDVPTPVVDKPMPYLNAAALVAGITSSGGTHLSASLDYLTEHPMVHSGEHHVVVIICDGQLYEEDYTQCRQIVTEQQKKGVRFIPILISEAAETHTLEDWKSTFGSAVPCRNTADIAMMIKGILTSVRSRTH